VSIIKVSTLKVLPYSRRMIAFVGLIVYTFVIVVFMRVTGERFASIKSFWNTTCEIEQLSISS